MATIESRPRSNGTTAYRLKWRYAGKRDGVPQSVTYDDHGDAKRMKGAVEALGHLAYDDDPRGITFELVTGQKPVTYTAPTFGEVAEKYIGSRTRAGAHSRDTYRATVTNRLSALVNRTIESVTDDDVRAVLNVITDAGQSATMAYEMACSVFKYAHNKGYVAGNPTLYVEAPKRRGRTANFLATADAAERRVVLDSDTARLVT
jgi:hypothetical protein